jgi:hypothetical protein
MFRPRALLIVMFAPAIVGAGMRLSAKAFETSGSALSNSVRRMAEGWRSALLPVKPEKIAQRRSDANGQVRPSPAPAGLLPLVSPSTAGQGASVGALGRAISDHFCPYRPFERRRSSAPSREQNQRMNHQGRILTWLSRVRVSDPIGSFHRSN